MKHDKTPDEIVREWLEIENERPIDKEIQIAENPVGWLCHDAYDNEQWMLYLENERGV